MKDVIKIALGVTSGLVIVGMVGLTISTYIAKTALGEIAKTSQNAMIQIQKNAEATAQRQREHQARIEAKQKEAKAQELKAQQAIIEAEQAIIKLHAEKTRAWEKFYKKSPECENPPTMNVMGECANIAIRTKRQFEEQWNTTHPANTKALPPVPTPTPLQADGSLPPGFKPYTPKGGTQRYGTQ